MIANQAVAALRAETLPVKGNYTCRFLPAMLQGVKAERGNGCGLRMAEDAKDAALFLEAIRLRIKNRLVFKVLSGLGGVQDFGP